MNDLHIKQVDYNQEIKHIQTIRIAVFQQEQNIPAELEFDGEDERSEHLLAYLDDRPVGTARIRSLNERTAKIERLAVLPTARGRGIGTEIMKKALAIIVDRQYTEAIVHAQKYIQNMYEKLGFEIIGSDFEEAGIVHVKMIKKMVQRSIF